jgi:hypothetical protein
VAKGKRIFEVRIWLSFPRVSRFVRPGISLGKEYLARLRGRPARLPSWRKHELIRGLQSAAKARGETLSDRDAGYAVDKAFAVGALDSAGNLHFVARGTREKIVSNIMETAAEWGKPMTHEEAEATADAAIGEAAVRNVGAILGSALILLLKGIAAVIICLFLTALAWIVVAAATCVLFSMGCWDIGMVPLQWPSR